MQDTEEFLKLVAEIKAKLKGKSYREISDLLSTITFEVSQEAIF